ncbi:uncharacterized protein PV09_01973 [Verruconis gallopava]|uniref:Altered inheritance of mitochondria protein 6 n=1 Tax=Verruconis gallopava TaxID=253628 RepID=A0A0D2B777_9PEZI|nr:uncharacterized protein PV09_01973 [Verruconis gallopava]KIW07089.1 hypothetical protein PV09_01973 [Verruconis gallopava]
MAPPAILCQTVRHVRLPPLLLSIGTLASLGSPALSVRIKKEVVLAYPSNSGCLVLFAFSYFPPHSSLAPEGFRLSSRSAAMYPVLSLPALLLASRALAAPVQPTPYDVSSTMQNILANTDGSNLYTYPTDLTRGIVPKAFHSHNDYWRDVPFYTAIANGAVSVEADVWLINGTLYVGHEISALTTARTLQSLYLDPIMDTLKRQNPTTRFVDGSTTKNGVFDTSSGQTVYLWIDLKTDGPSTLPAVLSALEPLYQAGYLTTTNGKTVKSGPITAIGTGNTPQSYFVPTDPASADKPRYIFFDAQLATLNETANAAITPLITPIASAQFSAQVGTVVKQKLNDTQLATLRSQIGYAKSKGIGARYWDTPGWPIGTRNAVWRTLLDEGVALLNADDVYAIAAFWEASG